MVGVRMGKLRAGLDGSWNVKQKIVLLDITTCPERCDLDASSSTKTIYTIKMCNLSLCLDISIHHKR